MSKRKLHPVSQVLELIDQLTDDQQAIVLDRLRSKQRPKLSPTAQPARRQSSSKKSAGGQGANSGVETVAATAVAGGGE